MAEGISRRGNAWPTRYRNPETGRQHERSSDRQVAAVRWRRQQLDALDRGRWVDPEAGKVSLLAYLQAWGADRLWTDGTRQATASAAGSTTFATVDLRLIRPSHVEAWVKSMTVPTATRKRPLAPGTIKTRFVNVRSVFRPAARDGMIAVDPTPQVRLPRLRRREAAMEIPTPEIVRSIPRGLRTAVPCLRRPPARRDRRPPDRRRRLPAPPGACARSGPAAQWLHRDSLAEVQLRTDGSRPRLPDADAVRPRRAGSPPRLALRRGRRRTAVPEHRRLPTRTTLQRAGVTGVRLHDLRHFYASGPIASGCDVAAVQRALGHAKSTTTLTTYAHLWPTDEDRVRDAAALLFDEVARSGEAQ